MRQGDYSLSARKGVPGVYTVCYKKRSTGYTVRKETALGFKHKIVVCRGDGAAIAYCDGLILALDRAVKRLEAERQACAAGKGAGE